MPKGDAGGAAGMSGGKPAGGDAPMTGGEKQAGSAMPRGGEGPTFSGTGARGAGKSNTFNDGDGSGRTSQARLSRTIGEGRTNTWEKAGLSRSRGGGEGKTTGGSKKEAEVQRSGDGSGAKKISSSKRGVESGSSRKSAEAKHKLESKPEKAERSIPGKSEESSDKSSRKTSEWKTIRAKKSSETKDSAKRGSSKEKSKEDSSKQVKPKDGDSGRAGKSQKEGKESKGANDAKSNLPDISQNDKHFTVVRDGKTYQVTVGYRGVRGQVKINRNPSAQKKMSAGTGDDASHQKSNESGGSGEEKNLTRQNPRLNRGEVKKLDNYLSNYADHGYKVRDHVTDVSRNDEKRPFMRIHKYHIYKDGKLAKSGEVIFANTHTPKSRELQGIKDKVSSQKDNVIHGARRFGARSDKVVSIKSGEAARAGGLKKVSGDSVGSSKQIRPSDRAVTARRAAEAARKDGTQRPAYDAKESTKKVSSKSREKGQKHVGPRKRNDEKDDA